MSSSSSITSQAELLYVCEFVKLRREGICPPAHSTYNDGAGKGNCYRHSGSKVGKIGAVKKSRAHSNF